MRKNNFKILSLAIILVFAFYLLNYTFVFAEEYKLSVPLGGDGEITEVKNLPQYISTIFQFGLGIAGLIALALIIYGAIQYTTSAGNVARQQDAKDRITSAIYGLILLLGAYLILNIINPELIQLKLEALKSVELKEVTIEFAFENKMKKLIQEAMAKLEQANAIRDEKKISDAEINKLREDLKNITDPVKKRAKEIELNNLEIKATSQAINEATLRKEAKLKMAESDFTAMQAEIATALKREQEGTYVEGYIKAAGNMAKDLSDEAMITALMARVEAFDLENPAFDIAFEPGSNELSFKFTVKATYGQDGEITLIGYSTDFAFRTAAQRFFTVDRQDYILLTNEINASLTKLEDLKKRKIELEPQQVQPSSQQQSLPKEY